MKLVRPVTLGLVAALGLTACGPAHPEAPAPRALPTASVQVHVVQMTESAGQVQAIGRVKNTRESTIARAGCFA